MANAAIEERGHEERLVIVAGLEYDVEAVGNGAYGGAGIILGGEVEHVGATGCSGIGDGEALKAPLLLEQLVEQPVVAGAGGAIERVVGGHYRARAALLKAGLKRRQVDLAQ